jgi:hypothetical protein
LLLDFRSCLILILISFKRIKYYNYSETSNETYALDDVFKCAKHFVSADHSEHDVFRNLKLIDTPDSEKSKEDPTDTQKESNEVEIVKGYFVKLIKNIESKINELKQSIERVNIQISTIYDQENLKNIKYNLHSVCIHEGNATSGHFWTYIWNTLNLKWYKFNDVEVCESTWDDLYANAVGGKSTKISNDAASEKNGEQNDITNVNESNRTSNKANERTPSAYFLIYTKAEDPNLYRENNLLDKDLNKYINEDQEALENQLNTLKLKQLLREANENLKKSNYLISSSNLSKNYTFFSFKRKNLRS